MIFMILKCHGAVRNFCGTSFHDFCVVHVNTKMVDHENLELCNTKVRCLYMIGNFE